MEPLVSLAHISRKTTLHRDTCKKLLDKAGVLPVDLPGGQPKYIEREADAVFNKRKSHQEVQA